MGRYLARRLVQMIPLLFGLTVIMFLLLVAAPGDPVDLLLAGNPKVKAADVERLREFYGLNDPLYVRYVKWLRAAGQGDFGYSRNYKVPVLSLVWLRIGNSLWLTIPAFVLALSVALPVGIYSALHQYSITDYFATFFTFFGISIPAFWFAIMMIYIFAVVRPWIHLPVVGPYLTWLHLPPGGFATPGVVAGVDVYVDRLKYMLLPVVVLSLLSMASLTRYTRTSMLEVVRQDYVRTARAKGLSERVVVNKHALRNALIPIVTILALAIPALFAGAPLTETVFGWPGVGRLVVESTIGGDYAVAMVALMFLALLTVMGNVVADVAYAMLDPRIRYD